ncbi:MAG TPA: M14 family zinc carboxypeptidase [Solirubrobacter sp.]|nr:M14 family zinc carboxypeptidase [Solirubrobacter sp.]
MFRSFLRLAAVLAAVAVPATAASAAERPAYPQQHVLPTWPDNPNDASANIGDIPYDEIAPKLNALQTASDRVSAWVGGKSSGGYDLYVAVVTAPETAAEAAQQAAWRQRLEDEPVAARTDPALLAGYKTPLFVNANIHGNEKEGTDAALQTIEELATSTDPAVAALLAKNILIFNVTSNPDGRVANTRANAAGYDLNRDLVTVSQPESRLIRDLIVEHRPIITLDLHGYVNPTLLHPSTPPHNVNDEYDLFIKHALPNALNIEANIAALGFPEVTRARIPFRDDAPGVWDDFPPIYVPSFALLQSSIPYTIEAPLSPGTGATRVYRADVDTAVHHTAIKTSLQYIQDHRDEVLFDQAEVYRRGWAGEPLRDIPEGYVPGWGPEDDYNTTFPRAYVIPAGERQHSAPAAKRLVDLLIGSGGRVAKATADFTAGGRSYPAGSYVIDLHQPKRGIVNSLLEPGIDLTDRVDDLYAGPGAWSQGLIWGATTDTLWDELPAVAVERVSAGESVGALPAGDVDLRIDPQDAADLLALNALLADGVTAYRLGDGTIVIPARFRSAVAAQVAAHGITVTAAPGSWSGARLGKVDVAYVGGSEARDTLAALGFPARAVTASTLASGLTDEVDVLLVASTLNVGGLNAANRAALDAFLARGGGVVGLGGAGATFTTGAAVLSATATTAPSLASGVVNVVNHGGPVSSGATPHTWVFPPTWYTNLGAGAVVEQSYAAQPLLAGWWGSNAAGTNGSAAAAGKASIVSATTSAGNGVVLIGTSPITRLHAKGLQPQLGRALTFAASPVTDDAAQTSVPGAVGGVVPATLALTLGAPASFGAFAPGVAAEYTASTTATVTSTAGDATLTVRDPSSVAPGRLVNGTFALASPLEARGDGGAFAPLTATLRAFDGPVSNGNVDVAFRQRIGASEPLRTGAYSKTLTFTLSTTTP